MSRWRSGLIFAGLTVAVACSDSKSPSSPGSTGGTSSNTVYNVAFDTTVFKDSAKAVVGATVPVRVQVLKSGSPAASATVTWTVGLGHGTVSAASTTTDASGFTNVVWTLGDTIGLNQLTAVAGDNSLTVRAVGVAGPATQIQRVTSDSILVIGGATSLITARVVDAFGNPVDSASVQWTSSDGLLSATDSRTGISGHAETAFTAPTAAGVSTVTATLAQKGTVTFRVGHVF